MSDDCKDPPFRLFLNTFQLGIILEKNIIELSYIDDRNYLCIKLMQQNENHWALLVILTWYEIYVLRSA